ncbi:MAG: response regulator, partial [Verrucomicrobiae bacterium]|nr:response regulator [Verrucomicrobiae bacterium]
MDAPESHYDYKKFAILYVDDEERSLKNFARAFGDQFRILTAPSAQEGLRLFEENPNDVALLITDQRMPGGKGVELLEKVRRARPRTIRILTSAYSDLEAAIDAVNSGAIYKYVTKPWDLPQLESTLKRAMEFFLVQRERDQILRAKLSELRKVVITDRIVSLGVLASGLGHYVRNSLVAVRTFMELMPKMLEKENAKMEQFQDKEFWNDFYAHVQTQLRHIVDLLQNLGEASEKPSFEIREEIDIASLFLESYSRLRP